VAVAVLDGGGQLRAGRNDRSALGGQERADVEFALEPVPDPGPDLGGARGDLGYHRGGPQVHDDVRAVGQHHGLGAVDREPGGDGDGSAHRGLGDGRGHPRKYPGGLRVPVADFTLGHFGRQS